MQITIQIVSTWNILFLPLFAGTTSGFLSSFSNSSSDSEPIGSVTFSFTGRNPGLSVCDPSLRCDLTFRTPRMTIAINNRAATAPTRIPRSGAKTASLCSSTNAIFEYSKTGFLYKIGTSSFSARTEISGKIAYERG